MKNFMRNCFNAGKSGQSCPATEGLGATGVELAIGGGIVAVAGVGCWILGSWVRGRHDAAPADGTKKAS